VPASAQHRGGRGAPSGGMPAHPGHVPGGMPHPQHPGMQHPGTQHPGMQHPLMNQFNMMQQMMVQEAYMQELRLQQQRLQKIKQQGTPKAAPQRAGSSLRGSSSPTVAIGSLSTASQKPATGQQPKSGKSATASRQPKHGKSAAASHPAATVQASAPPRQATQGRPMISRQAGPAKKSTTASQAVNQALEKERARKHKRWDAFRAWLLQNDLWATYA